MSDTTMFHRGDMFPHIQVNTLNGQTFRYATIWQSKQLVLVVVGTSQADSDYASALTARASEFNNRETECVVTHDDVIGLRTPSVVIADRWGEVIHIAEPSASGELPSVDELIEWVDYVRQRCPECEGESF
jgi:hypothetical protein